MNYCLCLCAFCGCKPLSIFEDHAKREIDELHLAPFSGDPLVVVETAYSEFALRVGSRTAHFASDPTLLGCYSPSASAYAQRSERQIVLSQKTDQHLENVFDSCWRASHEESTHFWTKA
jgi:hypothetical protein